MTPITNIKWETRREQNREGKEETSNSFLASLFKAGFHNNVHLVCFKKYRISMMDLLIFKCKLKTVGKEALSNQTQIVFKIINF